MIYISVDNDHHTSLALLLIKHNQWSRDDVVFISHRSPRNRMVELSDYKSEVVDVHPLCSGLSYKNPWSYWKSLFHQVALRKWFQFKRDDTLVITTEYEINNALFAEQMRRAGGQVYLFDEGIGFYFNNSAYHKLGITVADRFFLWLYNLAFCVLGIPAYAKKGFEGRMHVRIRDENLDLIYSRMRLPIDRPAKVCGYRNFLASDQAQLPKNDGEAIFFASNLEPFGVKAQALALSEETVRKMASSFSMVHLKIHPADWLAKSDVYSFYMGLVREYSNVCLVDNSISGNDALEKIRPKVVVGALGATMFDAFFFGCQPVFLFHLLPPVKEFGVCEFTLKNLGYRYVDSLADIHPGYECGVDISALLYEDEQRFPDRIGPAAPDHHESAGGAGRATAH